MTDNIPPIHELLQDPEERMRLKALIRAEQKERWGRWDYMIHPFRVVYGTLSLIVYRVIGNVLGFVAMIGIFLLRAIVVLLTPLWLPLLLILGRKRREDANGQAGR